MKTTVITSFHPEAYEQYAKSCLKSFDRWWPAEVPMVVYTEEPVKQTYRAEQRSLWDIPGIKEFIDDHQDPKFHGIEPLPSWSKKEIRAKYSWRFDAVKFCRQLFIPEHAASFLADGDIMVWLDADVISYAEVPGKFIEHLMTDQGLVTIGRDRGSTDIGFWAIRLSHHARAFLAKMAEMCRSRTIFNLYEWHSGFVFDHCYGRFVADGMITHRNLVTGNRSGHVWFDCEVGRYTDHLKGPHRKVLGYSPERPGLGARPAR